MLEYQILIEESIIEKNILGVECCDFSEVVHGIARDFPIMCFSISSLKLSRINLVGEKISHETTPFIDAQNFFIT